MPICLYEKNSSVIAKNTQFGQLTKYDRDFNMFYQHMNINVFSKPLLKKYLLNTIEI